MPAHPGVTPGTFIPAAPRVAWLAAAEFDDLIDTIVGQIAPTLRAQRGVGPDTASGLLVAAGDNPTRLHSEAAFAAICGTNPVPASSGKTQRHRLNRGGNRDANRCIHTVAITRLATERRSRDYVQRRMREDKRPNEKPSAVSSATSPATSTTPS